MNNEKFIPLSVPNLRGNELEYVSGAITSEWVSSAGKYVNQFETMLASYVRSKGAVSCQNGTSGLHLALMSLGVSKEDEVIVPALTFIAAVNPVRYIGASPVFMDCDDSLCIDPIKLESFLSQKCQKIDEKTYNLSTGKHISAIIIVHVFGNIADMEQIAEISKKYNLKIVEDATEALGSKYISGIYKDKFAGTIGDIGVYSFNGNKIITTGGGGMVVSNNQDLLNQIKHLSTQAKSDEVYFLHDKIGFNYRMTNLQAALGIAQLEQIEKFIEIKKANYELYYKLLKEDGKYSLLGFRSNTRPNYWFYSLIGIHKKINIKSFIEHMLVRNTQVRPIWGLINLQVPYREFEGFEISKAHYYVDNIINIPCSSNLSQEDVKLVVKRILDK